MQKTGGGGVTVEEGAMAEAEFLHDGVGAFPKQEAGFDGPAVLVIANPTLTLVAKQGSRGGFVATPSADDCGEVHVRTPWALKNRPTHVNLVVIGCQHIKTCQAGHGHRLKRVNKNPGTELIKTCKPVAQEENRTKADALRGQESMWGNSK